jgi:hypothetical protein
MRKTLAELLRGKRIGSFGQEMFYGGIVPDSINKGMRKTNQPEEKAVAPEVVEALGRKLTFWACWVFAFAMVLAVISLRCLYADGSFYLIEVLKAGNFVAIAKYRYCATFLFELPVVVALKLGVTNLHALELAFGVGSFLAWPISLVCCHRLAPWHFWLVMLACAAGYLNAGFMTAAEYNVAHAFFWPALFAIVFARPLKPLAATILMVSVLILLFSYQSLLFLGPPLALLAAWRAAAGGEKTWARVVLGVAAMLLLLSAAIALDGILHPQSLNNLGGFKHGILEIVWHPTWTMIWTLVWFILAAVVCVGGQGFTRNGFGLEKALFAWVMVIWALGPLLHPADTGADRGYELRSLQLMVPFALLVVAWLLSIWPGWFEKRHNYLVCFSASLLLAQSLWVTAATWQWHGFVGMWRGVLVSHRGPVPLADTPFTAPSPDGQTSNFEWTWANPSLSILLSPQQRVQAMILSEYRPPWQPFDPYDPKSLPNLQRYGIKYDDYLEALEKTWTKAATEHGKPGNIQHTTPNIQYSMGDK